MNKTELITAVAEKTGMSKKDADSAVNAVLDTIIEAVACEEKVQIVGFQIIPFCIQVSGAARLRTVVLERCALFLFKFGTFGAFQKEFAKNEIG